MTAPNMELRRAEEAVPTTDGYFYAKMRGIKGARILPVLVLMDHGTNRLFVEGRIFSELAHFDWFGPVPTCVESGS